MRRRERRIDPPRLLILSLFVVFLLLSVYNIGHTVSRLRSARAEIACLKGEEARVVAMATRLGNTIASLKKAHDRTLDYLAFVRFDLPAVEFLAALEEAVAPGIKIAAVEMQPGSARMRGSALTEQDVRGFAARLEGMQYIVSKVEVPVVTKGAVGRRAVWNFAISCDIEQIAEITAPKAAER